MTIINPLTPFTLVALEREAFDARPWHGYVLEQSDELLLLHMVSDRYDLDGYCAFRREHITLLDDDAERTDLVRRALRAKSELPSKPKGLDLSSMPALMATVQQSFGVLVISRELVCDDEVEIGAVRMASTTSYALRWLDAEGHWTNDDRAFRYADVSMLQFGGEYESTLLAVANERELEREKGAEPSA